MKIEHKSRPLVQRDFEVFFLAYKEAKGEPPPSQSEKEAFAKEAIAAEGPIADELRGMVQALVDLSEALEPKPKKRWMRM